MHTDLPNGYIRKLAQPHVVATVRARANHRRKVNAVRNAVFRAVNAGAIASEATLVKRLTALGDTLKRMLLVPVANRPATVPRNASPNAFSKNLTTARLAVSGPSGNVVTVSSPDGTLFVGIEYPDQSYVDGGDGWVILPNVSGALHVRIRCRSHLTTIELITLKFNDETLAEASLRRVAPAASPVLEATDRAALSRYIRRVFPTQMRGVLNKHDRRAITRLHNAGFFLSAPQI